VRERGRDTSPHTHTRWLGKGRGGESCLLPDLGGEEESRDRPQPGGERRAWVDERLVRAPWVVRADHARELLGKAHVELGASVHQEDDDAAAYVDRTPRRCARVRATAARARREEEEEGRLFAVVGRVLGIG